MSLVSAEQNKKLILKKMSTDLSKFRRADSRKRDRKPRPFQFIDADKDRLTRVNTLIFRKRMCDSVKSDDELIEYYENALCDLIEEYGEVRTDIKKFKSDFFCIEFPEDNPFITYSHKKILFVGININTRTAYAFSDLRHYRTKTHFIKRDYFHLIDKIMKECVDDELKVNVSFKDVKNNVTEKEEDDDKKNIFTFG